jgi:glycosyltransferase 2 family protein
MTSRTIWRIVQWCITVGALALVLLSVDVRQIPRMLASVSGVHVAAAIAMALAQFGIGAWRWQRMITLVSGKSARWKPLFDLYLMSFFASSILPGTITGDIFRVYYSRAVVESSAVATLIIALERILGLAILTILGAIAWLVLPTHPLILMAWPSWTVIIVLVLGLLVLAWLVFKSQTALMGRVRQWMHQLLDTVFRLPSFVVRQPWLMARVLIGTFLYQILAILIVFESLRAAQATVSFVLFLAVAPIITLLLILPISIQGIGVRESLYLLFLVPYGVERGELLVGLALTYLIGMPFIFWGWVVFSRRADEFGKAV